MLVCTLLCVWKQLLHCSPKLHQKHLLLGFLFYTSLFARVQWFSIKNLGMSTFVELVPSLCIGKQWPGHIKSK